MTTGSACGHTLVVYGSSARADATLRDLWGAAREQGRRVTVLALAAQEHATRGCCDTQSVLWNRICREMAREDLARAAQVVDGDPDVDFRVVVARGGRGPETVVGEALDRGADEIVLADPRASGLGRLELRRLRRRSPVPVS